MKRCLLVLPLLSLLLLSCQSYYITTHSPIQEAVDKKVGIEGNFHSPREKVLGEGAVSSALGGSLQLCNPAGLTANQRWTMSGALNIHYTSERIDDVGIFPQANYLDLHGSYLIFASPPLRKLHLGGGSFLAYDLSYDLDPEGDQHVKYSGGIRAYSASFGLGPWAGFSWGCAFDYLLGGQEVDIVTTGGGRNERYSFDGYRIRSGVQYRTSLPFNDLGLSLGATVMPHGVINRSGDFDEEVGLPLRWQVGLSLSHPVLVVYLGLGQTRWTETTSTEADIQQLYHRRYLDAISYSVAVEFPQLISDAALYFGYQMHPFPLKTDAGEKLSVRSFALGASFLAEDGKGLGWEIAGRYSTFGELTSKLVEGNISELVVGVSWGF